MTQTRRAALRVIITDEEQRRRAVDAVLRCSLDAPMEMTLQRYEPRRTLPMNALWWMWMQEMAKHFSKRAGPFSKDDLHILMKHQFLGYQDARTIGKTEIPRQLRSTADLTKGEMLQLMQQVDAWAADHGCLLTRPEDSEYDELARRQDG